MNDINALASLVATVAKIGNAVDSANKDGKIDINDAIFLAPVMLELPLMISALGEIPTEVGDLTEAEMDELTSILKATLDLENTDLEFKIETLVAATFNLVAAIYEMVSAVKGLKAEETDH